MQNVVTALCACFLLIGACASDAEEAPPFTLALPPETQSCPGVIRLHGASGWRPALAALASAVADSGFVTLTLDYYAEAGPAPRGAARLEKWPAYQDAVRRAVAYMESLTAVSGQPIGLVGFSRGAFLAVSVASSLPSVGAVVDFYGGGGAGTESIEDEAKGFPALLIIHGEDDTVVPVTFAEALRDAVVSAGGDVEVHIYPGAGHAFNVPNTDGYSREATVDSYQRMMEFLERTLKSQQTRAR